jgi:DUF971 family protein
MTTKQATPTPEDITVHSKSKLFEVKFSDGAHFNIPFELMRVQSPSAEVQGHGPGQETLQTGKRNVDIVSLEPMGNYAVKPTFSDGHESGSVHMGVFVFLGLAAGRIVERLRSPFGGCRCGPRRTDD